MALTPAQSAYLADLLTGIGTGLMSAPRNGPPLAGFSMGVQNANQLMAARRQQQDQDQERQFRAQQLARQQKLDAETDAAKAAQARALSQLLPTTANQAGMRMTGAGPGASNSVPAAPTLAGMTDQQMAVLRALPPDQALSMIGTQAFKAPNLDAPTTKDFNEGGNIVTKQWDPTSKSWVALSTAPRWQPVQPPQMPADVVAWQMDRKADPTNPNFKTIADWRKYQQAGSGNAPLVDLSPEQVAARGLPIGTVAQVNPNTNELLIKNKGAEGPGGMFDTKSIPGQALNFLAAHQQDPSSLEYAIAYAVASKPTTQFLPDGTVNTFTPDVSMFQKPSFAGPQQAVDAAAAAVAAPGPAPTPATPNAQATTPQVQPAAPQSPPAPAAPNPNIQTQDIPGGTVSRIQGGYQTPQDVQKLKDVKSQVGSITSALDNFSKVVKESPETAFLSAAAGGMTEGGAKLNSAWTNAALQTKAEALFNLGVLNGPDLALIQGTLQNPGTVKGVFASKAAYQAGIDQIKKLITDRISAYEAQYGPKTPNAPAGNAAPAGVFDKYGLTPPPASAQ